ncbi:MAG: MarR family transcriptional regulator [Rhodocyclales bacterium GT-UBC]|nr:MAG: MarR family transcriptional regulator [Rhodocyclales bacterium GT-UBC]
MNASPQELQLDVLQQFRVIYGSMRHYFRELEQRCGLPGSQTWVLQEVTRTPEIGVGELARRMGIHQSTCSSLVEKLVGRGLLSKQKHSVDQRRVGLCVTAAGRDVMQRLPGPADGVLPQALASMPLVSLKTLKINLDELLLFIPGEQDGFATTPLAEMVGE